MWFNLNHMLPSFQSDNSSGDRHLSDCQTDIPVNLIRWWWLSPVWSILVSFWSDNHSVTVTILTKIHQPSFGLPKHRLLYCVTSGIWGYGYQGWCVKCIYIPFFKNVSWPFYHIYPWLDRVNKRERPTRRASWNERQHWLLMVASTGDDFYVI
jgi:hypothetical protein